MNFLIIASFPDSILNFRGALIDELVANKLKVIVASPNIDKNGKVFNELKSKGIDIYEIPLRRKSLNPFYDLYLIFNLFRLIRKIRPEYILSYTIKPVIYGSIVARYLKVPNIYCLITGLGNIFSEEKNIKSYFLKTIATTMYSIALKGVRKVFFQNSDDQSFFRRLKIISNSNNSVVVNGSGVDINFFRQVPFPKEITFLLIARLLKSKGIREYANAAAIIKEKYPLVKFKLVGWSDGNLDSISKQELNQWVKNGTLEYLGGLEDVRKAISMSSVYVLPSFYGEGTPRSILEAMSMGRPIITTDVAGCRQTVIMGKNGYLVPAKSIKELSEAMAIFVTNPELAERMGKVSRHLAESKYDVRKVNAHMIEEMGL